MLKDKVAIITGGSRGIGFETAREFLRNGAKVVIFGHQEDTTASALDSLKKEFKRSKILAFNPNLASEKEISNVFEEVYKTFGKIDILINNAGVSSSTPLEKYTEEEMENIINVNIKGVFLCSKVGIKYLKETKGCIINTSSMVSIYGQRSGCLYPMTKFAVNGLTKSLARELAPFGVRVNAIAPGITATDMVKNLPEQMIKPLIAQIPLGRMGTPLDMANAFVFLASDKSSYITGEIMQVDGCMIS